MNIKLITGIDPLFNNIPSSKYFEINEFGNPISPSLINQKVMNYKGVDYVIYTQSEHVLNGFRIRLKNKTIDNLIIHFYKNDIIHNIEVNENGSIDNWVDGFFDQTDKDFKELFGF